MRTEFYSQTLKVREFVRWRRRWGDNIQMDINVWPRSLVSMLTVLHLFHVAGSPSG